MLKGIFKRLAIKRLAEEALYERAFEELRVGLRREGLWAKAIANSDGDESKAQGLYLKYRVQSMIDDGNIAEAYLGEINFSDKNKNESVMHFKGSNEAF